MVTPAEEQPETMTVDEFLPGARARLDRVQPQDLAREMADGALVIDTRTVSYTHLTLPTS